MAKDTKSSFIRTSKKIEEVEEEKIDKKGKDEDDFIAKKIEAIKNSQMPDYQKKQYIDSLRGNTEIVDPNAVSFSVYVRIKGIRSTVADAMRSYPDVVKTNVATVSQWDEILQGFFG